MGSDDAESKRFSLRRWSQRKLEAARATTTTAPAPAALTTAPTGVAADARVAPAQTQASTAAPTAAAPAATEATALPPVESLSFESDFTAFLQPKVDEALKRQALRKLFRDPRFNVMDGLDVYIDDYSKPDPIAPDVVKQMVQGRYIFDPPPTRVNEQGVVEDVPPEEIERARAAASEARAAAVEPTGAGAQDAAPDRTDEKRSAIDAAAKRPGEARDDVGTERPAPTAIDAPAPRDVAAAPGREVASRGPDRTTPRR